MLKLKVSKLRFYILSLMRLVVVAAGFHRVKVMGQEHKAKGREAPVIVIAPHSSFFDAIAIVCLGAPSVVAKADTARLPFIGLSVYSITDTSYNLNYITMIFTMSQCHSMCKGEKVKDYLTKGTVVETKNDTRFDHGTEEDGPL
ncbi:unnamed protein product [Colias eurytheme]|nr:unnamed protein product [Colias eurytheme]